MALVRWNPWNDLFQLQGQMDELFQSVTGDVRQPSRTTDLINVPVDIRQTDSEYVIEASAPGFKPDEVEVTFDDGVLTLRGERSVEQMRSTASTSGASAAQRRCIAGSVFLRRWRRTTSARRSRTAC